MVHDVGVDMQVEFAGLSRQLRTEDASGELVGMQIKTGRSYVGARAAETHISFYIDEKHGYYWLRYSLPMFIVLCDINTDKVYWERIRAQTLQKTDKGWKIEVPRDHVLTPSTFGNLRRAADTNLTLQRYRQLHEARQIIRLVHDRHDVCVRLTEHEKAWHGTEMSMCCDGEEIDDALWRPLLRARADVGEMLGQSFPWARLETNEDAYAADQRELWDASYRIWDHESGDWAPPRHSVSWEEYYEPPKGIVPVASSAYETRYQVDLTLNELGSAFISLHTQLWKGVDDRDIPDLTRVNG